MNHPRTSVVTGRRTSLDSSPTSWSYCPGVGLVSEGSADSEEINELVGVDAP